MTAAAAPQVVVRGEAALVVQPEIAVVHVTAGARARDRQTALERCTARQAAVDRVVREAGAAVEQAETAAVSVWEPWLPRDRRPGEPVARISTRLTVADLDRVGDLVVALGGLDGVELAGPSWALRPDSPAYERARLAAVRDGVRRARSYAAAFGAELLTLVQVADEGLSRTGGAQIESAAAMAIDGAPGGGPSMELTPAEQWVRGAVELRFTMSAPAADALRG